MKSFNFSYFFVHHTNFLMFLNSIHIKSSPTFPARLQITWLSSFHLIKSRIRTHWYFFLYFFNFGNFIIFLKIHPLFWLTFVTATIDCFSLDVSVWSLSAHSHHFGFLINPSRNFLYSFHQWPFLFYVNQGSLLFFFRIFVKGFKRLLCRA